jgi:general secretion pathway protein B
MSSILKALKKLEHEKAVPKPGAFRIDTDILQGGSTRRTFSSGALLAAIAIFACGVGATYFFMRPDTQPVPVQHSQASKSGASGEPSTGSQPMLPVSATPAIEPLQRPEELQPHPSVKAPLRAGQPERGIQSQERQQQFQRLTPIESLPQPTPPEPRSASPATPPAAAPVPPVLKVDGIAFQDGGTDGVAVVNGVAVSRGSLIEGARVEEIQKDRVRFSRGSEKFEIILDKSN